MSLSADRIRASLDALAAIEPGFARALARIGYPEPRIRPPGYATLLRTIVGQQVSLSAASAIWDRMEAAIGAGCPPRALLALDTDALRACGLSRQKQAYTRSLAELVLSGALDFDTLPADDEEAIALLTRAKGVGRWSAEIYLLFAEGRPDIWPAGDLAVQESVRRILDLDERPTERQMRAIAEPWSPHRSAATIFAWHYRRSGDAI